MIHPTWRPLIDAESAKPYWAELRSRVIADRASGPVYPPSGRTFAALQVPLPDVRVVVVGQDPYHGPGQAHGLAFSVPPGVQVPPSLRVVLEEVKENALHEAERVSQTAHEFWDHAPLRGQHRDVLGKRSVAAAREVIRWRTWQPRCGDLTPWLAQGVLLLNTVLTVRAGQPGSHRGCGWENFTGAVLDAVTALQTPVVWMLWGSDARRVADRSWGTKLSNNTLIAPVGSTGPHNHLILTAPHPSPLAARSGYSYAGCRHFSRCNQWLRSRGEMPVDWYLPEPGPDAVAASHPTQDQKVP